MAPLRATKRPWRRMREALQMRHAGNERGASVGMKTRARKGRKEWKGRKEDHHPEKEERAAEAEGRKGRPPRLPLPLEDRKSPP